MTAERWQRIKSIFNSAVECDPAARAEFLRRNCGSDEEIRREVESLLASDGEITSVMASPIVGAAARVAAPVRAATLVLKDRYEVERELGRGGMSVVYLARDRQLLAKRVVVKVLLEETRIDPWMRQKFQQEMEALARIDHPGVVGVLDHGLTAEGKQFLVMQYIEGETLRNAMEPGSLDFRRAAGLIRQVGRALAAAHEKGVWHRDLKPENIMLQRLGGEEHVKLIDFGIAGIQNSQFGGEKSKVAGTLTYMAPEQFAGHPCAASDTYALGVVAYEMLTGKRPFAADSMMHLVAEDKMLPAPSRELRPDLPAAAAQSIRKAMSFRPERRQAEVSEFSEELHQALSGTLSGSASGRRPAVPGTVEIAHVLFTDLVGYSLLPMDRQKEYLGELQEVVRESPQFRAAEEAAEIISLPTGDGMALAFFGDPTAPAQCALEVAAGLKSRPHLKLRMGINSGPVYRVADVNANANVAGGGINLAQRVMDCGDAGHILVSKSVAEVLSQLSQWSPYLTDLGECTVKHGVKVHLCNLTTAEVGNRERPSKLAAAGPKVRSKAVVAAVLAVVLIAAAAGAWWLGRGGKSSPAPDQPSIAVLPFTDLSAEKNQEYLSEGIAEELLNALCKIPGLRVAGRTSSFQFKGKAEESSVIGRKLHVATLLEGSVRRQGNRARITTQLIKAVDGVQLWSEIYDRDMNDMFAVQENVGLAVAGALKITLLGRKTATSAKSTNVEAYNAYLQGRYFLARGRNPESLEKAVGHFAKAVKLDPGYGPAWVGLGESRTSQALVDYIPRVEGYRMAREAVEHALAMDAELGEAHSALGRIKFYYDRDVAGADASYQRALLLEPGNARVISAAGTLAKNMGRLNDAIALYRRALEIDPLNSSVYYNAGIAFYYAGQYDEAAAHLKKALELVPQRAIAHCLLAQVYLAQGRPREALSEAQQETHQGFRLSGLALVNQALGHRNESDANLGELIAGHANDASVEIAEVYAFRGEADKAFFWLERAYVDRDSGLAEMKGNPLLRNLQHDPRYPAFLKRVGLPL